MTHVEDTLKYSALFQVSAQWGGEPLEEKASTDSISDENGEYIIKRLMTNGWRCGLLALKQGHFILHQFYNLPMKGHFFCKVIQNAIDPRVFERVLYSSVVVLHDYDYCGFFKVSVLRNTDVLGKRQQNMAIL